MATILVVEDDEHLRVLMEEWLILEKYSVVACCTGQEALERLKALYFDAIVLDWHLPDTTGPEVLRKYRASGGTSPVFLLTGSSGKTDKQEALDAGATDFLHKPFKLSKLSAILAEQIARKV